MMYRSRGKKDARGEEEEIGGRMVQSSELCAPHTPHSHLSAHTHIWHTYGVLFLSSVWIHTHIQHPLDFYICMRLEITPSHTFSARIKKDRHTDHKRSENSQDTRLHVLCDI